VIAGGTAARRPPRAAGLPVIGSLFALVRDAQDFVFRQYLERGSVFTVRALGREFTVLAGPDINVMMAAQPDAFSAGESWEPIVRDFGARRTLTMMEGAEHARLRSLMRRTFSRVALTDALPTVIETVRSALRREASGRRIPVVRFMQRLTADVLGLVSNGQPPGEHFDDILLWWNTVVEVHLAHRRPASALRLPRYRQARARVQELARTIFDSRQAERSAGTGGEDHFLDNLADASARDPEFLSRDDVLLLAVSAYFAGLDTVANVSSFMLYELLRQPELLRAARDEADRIFAGGGPTPESLRGMRVLHAAAMETMRLYPIAGLLPRTAARDFEFGGYTIRQGEPFLAATCASHFSPRFFADPDRFDIGRYAEPRNEHKVRGVYAPFGAGPHTCLGAGLAEAQIAATMATLLHEADLALDPPGYRVRKAYTPSLSPKGLGVKLTGWRPERPA
jgi:cytochrome P450